MAKIKQCSEDQELIRCKEWAVHWQQKGSKFTEEQINQMLTCKTTNEFQSIILNYLFS